MDQLLLTVDEVCHRLRIGRSHLYAYLARGDIESVRLGRARRIPAAALDHFVEKLRADVESGSQAG